MRVSDAAPSLFAGLLGAEFSRLPPQVAKIHTRQGMREYAGEVQVRRGKGLFLSLCASAARLPPTRAAGPLRVEIEATHDGETWTRRFGSHLMASRLWPSEGLLAERLGLLFFGFKLSVNDGVLMWQVERVSAAGIALPKRWFKGVVARESEQDGRYRFEVGATLPLLGELIHYTGWLDVD